jgi:hypothetical protein
MSAMGANCESSYGAVRPHSLSASGITEMLESAMRIV